MSTHGQATKREFFYMTKSLSTKKALPTCADPLCSNQAKVSNTVKVMLRQQIDSPATFRKESHMQAANSGNAIYNLFSSLAKKKFSGEMAPQAANLENKVWEAVEYWFDQVGFPFDSGYVNQDRVLASINKVCADYGVADAAPFVALIIYSSWREEFFAGTALVYQCPEDEDDENAKRTTRIACIHEPPCPQVESQAYAFNSARTGDAVDLHSIPKPQVPKADAAWMDDLWSVLHKDNELPQGQLDYGLIRHDLEMLLYATIQQGGGLDLSQGTNSLAASVAELLPIYAFSDVLQVFRPEHALMLLCHSIICRATKATRWELVA